MILYDIKMDIWQTLLAKVYFINYSEHFYI